MSDKKKGGPTPQREKLDKSLGTSHQTGSLNQSGHGQSGKDQSVDDSSDGGSSEQSEGGSQESDKS